MTEPELDKDLLNKFCRPQFLHAFDDLGFSFNVVGVFGQPDVRDESCIYTCLVSLAPPAEPYKVKGCNSMLFAHHFFRQDWSQSCPKQNIFREVADHEVGGKIFRPNKYTGLVFDVKRFNLKTGELSDIGFGYQYLVHSVDGVMYLIGGQYQVPIFKGPMPKELLDSFLELDSKLIHRPDKLLRHFCERGEIQQQGNM